MTINFQVNQETACGFFTCTDLTSVVSPETRSSYGWAMFYNKDNSFVGGDLSNDGTDLTPGVVSFNNIGNGKYQFYSFIVPVYDPDTTYNNGDIVYTSIPILHPATGFFMWKASSSEWMWLTQAVESIFEEFQDAANIQQMIITEIADCPVYFVTKTACLQWTIQSNAAYNGMPYTVTDYSGTPIANGSGNLTGPTLIAVPSDGIYYFIISNPVQGVLANIIKFETCNLRKCVESMINAIISRCDDPCSQTCDANCNEQNTIFRNELNKVIALYYPLLAMIYSDVTLYAGISSVNEQRQNNINTIGQMLSQLIAITTRCGLCSNFNWTTFNGSNDSGTYDCGC